MDMELKPGLIEYCNKVNNSITCQFPIVKKWDLPMICSVTCKSENNILKEDTKEIIVYNRDLVIAPHPEVMEINKTYQLHCTGPRVYPNNKLHLKWLRGNKVVKSVNPTEPAKFPDNVTLLVNILNLNASKADDGQVYTCLAELDLDTNTTKEIKSSSVTLQTYSFPKPPRILNRKPIEVNEEATLECEVQNVYPAEKLTVTWFHNEEELKSVTKTSASHDIWATTWTPQDTGLTELTCRADFEDYPLNLTRSANISIEVYVFSEPVIQASLTIVEGKPVNITCSVFNVSGELQLTLKNGNTSLPSESSSTEHTIYHTLHPKMELNGQQLTCEAKLTLQNHSEPIVKQQNITLNVQSEETSWAIIMGFSIVGAIIIIMAVICCCLIDRARKTGEHNVLNPTPSKHQEIPRVNEPLDTIPLQEVI
ncbi:intercellular adhesion molecule 5-like isoform X1 [Amblyraja radiata]|uniref:intercellular adhesion molecule 5-like isoform X1 n=1 Tax=Amblyraja radiata TaxID=386614 RepID=UPI0014035DE5|nr:intercellular adhesion molecule 5-like isoform X1 [Amblyraja radiata]